MRSTLPRFYDDAVEISRLGLNEKKILVTLRWHEIDGPLLPVPPLQEQYGRYPHVRNHDRYQNGEILSIPRLMQETKIASRASISRTLRRLVEKSLVISLGYCIDAKEQDDRYGSGQYTKYVELTAAGSEIADQLVNEGFTVSSF